VALFKILMIAALMGLVVFGGISVHAQSDESEESRQASEKAKRRRYAGGKDEQELTVQVVLPAPSRYPVDPKPLPVTTGKEQPAEDIHD
jgi:hypothetical protein